MERGWTQVSLDGVEGRGDTGIQAGEEGGHGEANSRGGERGANSRDIEDADFPGLGEGLTVCAGQGRVGRKRELPRSLGSRREGGEFHQGWIWGQL